jgi:formylglycine-generating enzyme required for sulfatase activity
MKKTMISVCALLLISAASMMTDGAQGSGKPTLAVFVVGMQTDALGNDLAQQIAAELNRNSRYTVLPSANNALANKLAELCAAHTAGKSIDRNALSEWGRTNGVSTICLVADAIKGNDHMFYALLIDAKDSKVSGRGSYIRTGVTTTDLPRVSLALSRQLDGPGRRPSAPARSYPAELDIEMVRVEGGTFTMGCTTEQGADCAADEKPAHTITVSSFSIGKYQITRAQWIAVMKGHGTLSNPGNWKTDDQLPIESVSWFDIDTVFLPRLNALTGRTTTATKYRLPREAEWEYAARGCKAGKCDSYKYSGSDNIGNVAWYSDNSGGGITHPVGQKEPNGLGIYDMSGNTWEWCYDWYAPYSASNYLGANATDYTGPTSGSARVCHGGRAGNAAVWLRVAARAPWWAPSRGGSDLGFRVVLP